jgi:hypothetical protein
MKGFRIQIVVLCGFIATGWIVGCAKPAAEAPTSTQASPPPAVAEPPVTQAAPKIEHEEFVSAVPKGWRLFDFKSAGAAQEIDALPNKTEGEKLAREFLSQALQSKLVAAVAFPLGSEFQGGTLASWIVTKEKATLADYQKGLPTALGVKPDVNEIRKNPERLVLVYGVAGGPSKPDTKQAVVQLVYVKGERTLTISLSGEESQRAQLVKVADELATSVTLR